MFFEESYSQKILRPFTRFDKREIYLIQSRQLTFRLLINIYFRITWFYVILYLYKFIIF